jgi:hypothetical protein
MGLCFATVASILGSVTVQPWKIRSPVSSSMSTAGQLSPPVSGSMPAKTSAMVVSWMLKLRELASSPLTIPLFLRAVKVNPGRRHRPRNEAMRLPCAPACDAPSGSRPARHARAPPQVEGCNHLPTVRDRVREGGGRLLREVVTRIDHAVLVAAGEHVGARLQSRRDTGGLAALVVPGEDHGLERKAPRSATRSEPSAACCPLRSVSADRNASGHSRGGREG